MIIERYVYREILHRLFWIGGLLWLVLATNKFVEYLGDAAAGKIPPDFVFKFLGLKMLAMQTEVLPVILFLATILAFSRLNQDNELAVLAVAGVGKPAQLRIVLKFAFFFGMLVAFIAFFAAPWAKSHIDRLKDESWQTTSISGVTAGKFRELNAGESVVYVESLSGGEDTMENVFLQMQHNGRNSVIRSETAKFDVNKESGNRFVVFENGVRYLGNPGMLDYYITEYEKYGMFAGAGAAQSGALRTEALSSKALFLSDAPRHQAELQWRISAIVICILLAMLGVLVNHYPFDQKPFTLVLFGILVYFIYNNLLGISRTLLERGDLPALPGLWWVHAALAAIIFLIYKFPVLMQRYRGGDAKTQILPAAP